MDFELSAVQRALKGEIVEFARSALNQDIVDRDRRRYFDRDLWRRCGTRRLQGLPIPEELGGRGLSSLDCAIALDAFGYSCEDGGLAFAVGAHCLACAVPIWKHGNPDQMRHWLPKLCDGTLIGANAMTEPGAGSDVFSITTEAVPESDGFRLNGTKTLITNAATADVAIVFAVTDRAKAFHGGLTAFLIDLSSAGVERGERLNTLGVRTCEVGQINLSNLWVPRDSVLGTVGGGSAVFTTAMEWERSCLFAMHVGAMERLLELAVRRARTRSQFGQPIGKFEAVSHRVADMKVQLEAARLLAWRSAWRLEHARSAALDASLTKLFVSESFLQTAIDAVRVCGGCGLLEEHHVERVMRDAMTSTIYSGTSDIQRSIISRWLGL